MNRSKEDALHAVLQTDPQVSLFFFLSAALYQSFCTFPRKIEACVLQSTEPISIVIQYTDPLDYEIWRREPQKNTGGHNNVPCAWEQSCTFSHTSVHWCERLSFSGKLQGCTGVIQRLGGELKFGGCYKRMLMFSSASSLWWWLLLPQCLDTHSCIYYNVFCRPRAK